MRLNRWIAVLFVLALVAVPSVAGSECAGKAHEEVAEAQASCCAGATAAKFCGADCPHAEEALTLAEAAEKGDEAAMEKLVALVKESGHEEAVALAAKAEGGCHASQTALIAMVKSHVGSGSEGDMVQMAQAAGKGCAKSTANLIAAAKKSDDPKIVALAERAEGGCTHSKQELIALVGKQGEAETE
jgi:hypothetical protein